MTCTSRPFANRIGSPAFSWVADVDRLLNDFVGGVDPKPSARGFVPALDLTETADQYRLVFELPGVSADDVNIEVKNDSLTVSGEKKAAEALEGAKEHRLERSFGQFQRTLQFPQAVDFDRAEATFDAGLLQLVVPKSAKALPRKIQITSRTVEAGDSSGS